MDMARTRGYRKGRNAFSLVELPFDRLMTIRKCKGNAFSLVELLVVVAIIALLISIMLPSLGRAQEKARQTMCMANVKGINQGWEMFKAANKSKHPILPGINQLTAHFDDALKMSDTCDATNLGTGAQQNLCLLVKIGAVPWEMFLCPSGETEAAERGSGRTYGMGETDGGANVSYCDYAIQIPYVGSGSGWTYYPYEKSYCPLTKHMDGGIAILADRGDNRGSNYNLLYKWSRNHPDDGESVLYVDGHVTFSKDTHTSPAGVEVLNTGGWGGNNIYTAEYWRDRDTDNPYLHPNAHGYDHSYRSNVQHPCSTKDSVLYAWGD